MYAYANKFVKSNKEHNPVQAKSMSPYESKFPTPRSNVIQMRDKPILNAKTVVKFKDGGERTGEGKNKGGDVEIATTLDTIRNHSQTRLIPELPQIGNLRGVCAEPRSLAAALRNGPGKAVHTGEIEEINVYPAIIEKLNKNMRKKKYKEGESYQACGTCHQWVPNLGKDKSTNPVKVKRLAVYNASVQNLRR